MRLRYVLRLSAGGADVLDILADLHGIAVMAAHELRAPAPVAHLAAIGLAVFEDLDLSYGGGRRERDRVVDQVVLADDRIDEKVAVIGLPGAQRTRDRP